MQYAEAREKLKHGGEWAELVEAAGVVIAAPECSELDLFLALRHGGVIAEQAALALYRKTQTPIPADRSKIAKTTDGWVDLIMNRFLQPRVEGMNSGLPSGSLNILEDADYRARVRNLLTNGLTRVERLLLMCYYYEDMSFDQIGPILDMTEDQIRTKHREILQRVRETVGSDAKPLSRLFRDVSS